MFLQADSLIMLIQTEVQRVFENFIRSVVHLGEKIGSHRVHTLLDNLLTTLLCG